jgi:chemotaxis protein methyltransferase CheR
MLERARRGCYRGGSLRELAEPLRTAAFRRERDLFCLRDRHRASVTFRCEDLRRTMPAGPFDVILCRYLAFNYFDEPTQRTMAERFAERLYPCGVLVIGAHDTLPEGVGLTERGPSVFG